MRKGYRLTPAGNESLMAWVELPATDAEVRDEQLVKALCYGFLPPERAIELLRAARAHHAERKAYYEELVRHIDEERQSDDPHKRAAALGQRLTARCQRAGELCRLV